MSTDNNTSITGIAVSGSAVSGITELQRINNVRVYVHTDDFEQVNYGDVFAEVDRIPLDGCNTAEAIAVCIATNTRYYASVTRLPDDEELCVCIHRNTGIAYLDCETLVGVVVMGRFATLIKG